VTNPTPTAPEISGFTYVSTLGRGGFSDVYLYEQRMPRRKVAVKVLHVDSLDRQLRRQFVAEANVMAQLSSHPSIATIYSAAITEADEPYMVMEYCSRGSLADTYRSQPLSVEETLRLGVRIAAAIETAHRSGIIHRDVKPANILLTDYRAPVLTDFGISAGSEQLFEATMLRSDATSTATSTSGTQGLSVPWAPPEAFDEEPVGTPQSDIYSLAATLLTLLEGRTPFEIAGGNNGVVQLSRRIERGELTPSDRSDIPASVRAVLATAMSLDPAARFASAAAFGSALQALEIELGFAATPMDVSEAEVEHIVDVAAGGEPGIETAPRLTLDPELAGETVLRVAAALPEVAAAGPEVEAAVVPAKAEVEAAAESAHTHASRSRRAARRGWTFVGVILIGAVAAVLASVAIHEQTRSESVLGFPACNAEYLEGVNDWAHEPTATGRYLAAGLHLESWATQPVCGYEIASVGSEPALVLYLQRDTDLMEYAADRYACTEADDAVTTCVRRTTTFTVSNQPASQDTTGWAPSGFTGNSYYLVTVTATKD
jgi:tRNA A-37 threonylcarbamoyl transferase component Bud32